MLAAAVNYDRKSIYQIDTCLPSSDFSSTQISDFFGRKLSKSVRSGVRAGHPGDPDGSRMIRFLPEMSSTF